MIVVQRAKTTIPFQTAQKKGPIFEKQQDFLERVALFSSGGAMRRCLEDGLVCGLLEEGLVCGLLEDGLVCGLLEDGLACGRLKNTRHLFIPRSHFSLKECLEAEADVPSSFGTLAIVDTEPIDMESSIVLDAILGTRS